MLPPVAPPRVTVFGGSGFIGRRVCKALVLAGASVTSVSRGGCPAVSDGGQSWQSEVNWVVADASTPEGAADALRESGGAPAAVVSCIGNILPADSWSDFWGLHWDDQDLKRENGDVNENIARAAAARAAADSPGSAQAPAMRFVYLSVSEDVANAYEGALEGYIDGKRQAEEAAQHYFGRDAVIVGPSLVFPDDEGGLAAAAGAAAEGLLRSPPVKGYLAANRWLTGLSWQGEDLVTKVALTEPVGVAPLARTVAAAALGAGTFAPAPRPSSSSSNNATRVDGSAGIRAAAADETTTGDGALKAAAAAMALAASSAADPSITPPAPPSSSSSSSSTSSMGSSSSSGGLEVKRRTWKPLLYPIAPTCAVLAVIAFVQSTIPPTAVDLST